MRRTLRCGGLLLLLTLVASACSSPAASFDPKGACVRDGSASGAYPELEALVPTTYRSAPPDLLDSGRNCTAANLGTMAALGFTEVRFAGGTWTFGAERAAVLAVFSAKGLTADVMADFYAASARTANRTAVIANTRPTLAGRPGRRLDTKTGTRLQTVIVWPAGTLDRVNVVITNDLPDARIAEAVDAFGGH